MKNQSLFRGTTRPRGVLAVAALLSLLPVSAFAAATVKGKVVNTQELLNPVWNEAKDPAKHRFNFREPASTVPADARILRGHISKELCIAALQEKGEPLKTPIRVVVAGGRTSPVTIVVPPGQELQFENHDPFPHNIYEVSGKGGFGEGAMLPDKNRNWTPPGPGTYEIRDKLAPSLRSWVVVEAKVVKSVYPNRKGDFAMELEPGSYTLVGFFNGQKVGDPLQVEVKPAPAEQLLKDPLKVGPDKKTDAKDDKKQPEAPKGGH
jgi:plastocyanin